MRNEQPGESSLRLEFRPEYEEQLGLEFRPEYEGQPRRESQPQPSSDSASNNPDDLLICVDLLDRQIGVANKLECHKRALLHRAFSVVLWRRSDRGPQLLLQQRAMGKYHSGGLWANSCCSHPRAAMSAVESDEKPAGESAVKSAAKSAVTSDEKPAVKTAANPAGESLETAVERRLAQELGVHDVRCSEIGSFVYFASYDNGLSEYEYDHVFLGEYSEQANGSIAPDPEEIMDTRWVSVDELDRELRSNPRSYAVWLFSVAGMALRYLRDRT